MKTRAFLGLGIIAVMLTVLAGCGGGDQTSSSGNSNQLTLRIGYSGAFSGLYAAYDQPPLGGMEFAVRQINASGGPVKVQLTSMDNKGDTQLTATQTQELLDNGILLNVVGVGDGRVAAGRLISDRGGLALGALNSYPTWVQQAGAHAALVTVPDNVQASADAKWACDQGYKTAYTLTSNDTAYTQGIPAFFADAFDHYCGGKIVGNEIFSLGATDFSPQITSLGAISPAPDLLFSSIFIPDSNAFVKQLRQAGSKIPFLTTDANFLPDFVKAAGSSAEGTVMSTYGFPEPGSQIAKFLQEYKQLTGSPPQTTELEAVGRDQIYALAIAAQQAGSTDPGAILKQLSQLPNDALVALRDDGLDPATRLPKTAQLSIAEVKNGQFKLLDNIVPNYVPHP